MKAQKRNGEDLELWIEENDIDRKIVKDKRKFNYKKSYFFDSLQKINIKLHIYKSTFF